MTQRNRQPEERIQTANIAAGLGLFVGLVLLVCSVVERDLLAWIASLGIIASSGAGIDLSEYLKARSR